MSLSPEMLPTYLHIWHSHNPFPDTSQVVTHIPHHYWLLISGKGGPDIKRYKKARGECCNAAAFVAWLNPFGWTKEGAKNSPGGFNGLELRSVPPFCDKIPWNFFQKESRFISFLRDGDHCRTHK